MTTNYNDGAWHGWNGGPCPVHPESTVKVKWGNGVETEEMPSRYFAPMHWRDASIIAFRVVKPYTEPHEGWIVPGQLYDSARQAKIAHPGVEPIKVREVKE